MSSSLRIVVATPLSEELCTLIEARHPDIELVRDHSLLPPERWAADFSGDPTFKRTPQQQAAFEALVDSADVLYGIPDAKAAPLARAVRANPRLRWVQGMAAGAGATVKGAALTPEELSRVVFTTGAGAHVGPLSEYAVFGLLAGAKDLPRLRDQQAKHEWSGRWPMRQLGEQTILVVGMGHVGREIARKLSLLGAKVIGVDINHAAVEGVQQVVDPAQMAEFVGQVDGIVNTLPGTAATFHLISADVFANVRPGTTLVSLGRGTAVDEPALIAALRDGRIGFAVLDVFEKEPLPTDSPLWDMPNVIVSPHSCANDPGEERRLVELFCDNLDLFKAGRPLQNTVNTEQFF